MYRNGLGYQLAQGSAREVGALGQDWLRQRLHEGEHVLVCWPGLALPALAGEWLAWMRSEQPTVTVAHLSYPAPRGELAADPADARRLRRHRVLCCLPAGAAVDRGDAYLCPRCGGRPLLRTDQRNVWLACPQCQCEDRRIILTLNEFRADTVRVLFAEYRIARYLTSGPGRRYGGAFTKTIRCQHCHRPQVAYSRPTPWERAELDRLVRALTATWDADDRAGSLRRAIGRVVRQLGRPSPVAQSQTEDALRRLLDAGVMVDGQLHPAADRLLRGTSLCCDAPLLPWRR
jgi:hypothetical protein